MDIQVVWEEYNDLDGLLNALQSESYGYVICRYNSATYCVWTSSYESAESTDRSYAQLLGKILGIASDNDESMGGDWASYMMAGQVHFTTNVTKSTVYSS